jgi:hypothetical protein
MVRVDSRLPDIKSHLKRGGFFIFRIFDAVINQA